MTTNNRTRKKVETATAKTYTLEQYFDKEYRSEMRHEFLNGHIRAMAYTSEIHGKIVSNLIRHLGNCKADKDCDVYGSDRMILVEKCNKVFYPDIVVVCGEQKFYQYKKNMRATLNPKILIEVSSPSTENEDKIDKWSCYRHIESLEQYIIVSHRTKLVNVYERTDIENKWLVTELSENDILELDDCKIPLSDIYDRVVFE